MNPKVLIGVFIILLFEGFWGLFIPTWLICLCLIPCFTLYVKSSNSNFVGFWGQKIFFLFLLSIIVNLIFSYYNRHQSPIDVICNPEFLFYLYFFSFYIFINIDISPIDIEKIIKLCYFIFLPCYFLEYFVFYPEPVFELLTLTEDEHRFRMIGQLVGFIGYFYYLNKTLTSRRVINLVWASFGLIFVFLLGFRVHLVAMAIASLYLTIRIVGMSLKVIIKSISVFVLIVIGILSTDFGSETMENIMNRQENQTMDNDDYIRVAQLAYFTQDHFISTSDYIFGSGIPSGRNSYSRQMTVRVGANDLQPTQWRDWGLLGLSWVMGLPMLFVLLYFAKKMITSKVPKQYYFISATYIELLLVSLLNVEFYRNGAFVFHGLMLCLVFQLERTKVTSMMLEENRIGLLQK